jgi:hypothetical protein
MKQTGKAVPATGRGGAQGCETSRLPHFLDNRLIDGDEVVSLTRRLASLYPQEDFWYSFLLETGRIRSTEKSSDLTGIRTRDLPACSIVPP